MIFINRCRLFFLFSGIIHPFYFLFSSNFYYFIILLFYYFISVLALVPLLIALSVIIYYLLSYDFILYSDIVDSINNQFILYIIVCFLFRLN